MPANKTVLQAIAAAALAAGCSAGKPPPQAPSGAAARALVCGAPERPATKCLTRLCEVTVSLDASGKWKVSPYDLNLTQRDSRILWKLKDGASFSDSPGKKHIQFTNSEGERDQVVGTPYPTDEEKEDGRRLSKGPNLHMLFKNDSKAKEMRYQVTFDDQAGKKIVCDPTINNSPV